MKRTQLNLVLLVLVAGLGAAAYFGQKKEEKGTPLTALTADTLTQIALEHPGRPKILLKKSGSQWQLLEPVQADTDPFEVSALVGLATVEAKRRIPVAEVKLPELGLQPAAYRVRLNDTVLDMGEIEPIEARRYVLAGNEVALIDDPPSAALDADYSDLVSKALVPDTAEIVKIELKEFQVVRSADGKAWSMLPLLPAAATTAPQQLAEAWKGARAMWMAAELPEGSSGDPVRLTLKDGRVIELLVAERDPQLVLARPDLKLRYTLSKALEPELLTLSAARAQPKQPSVDVPAQTGSPAY
ncbi:MAG TPA: DUF4340 domain-containing protein [Solimonas sp.]|nr:DUF4340 domain-containing protein [Solimonas sp.]